MLGVPVLRWHRSLRHEMRHLLSVPQPSSISSDPSRAARDWPAVTRPPAPTRSRQTVPVHPERGQGLHHGRSGVGPAAAHFHAGLLAAATLPYRRRDLCWLQISGWSQLGLFGFCGWLLGRGSARRDFDLEFKPTPIRATEPLITTLQPLRLKQQQKQTQNLGRGWAFLLLGSSVCRLLRPCAA